MYCVQPPLLALKDFFHSDSNDRLVSVLAVLDLEPLLQLLDHRRGRGRKGYSHRILLQAVIAAWVYNLHSMAELRRELIRNGSLRLLCGISSVRSEEHTSELQSQSNIVCRLLLEKIKSVIASGCSP